MAQYNRPPWQKPKKPDEFISFFDHLVRYFEIHRNKLWILVALSLAALGGYAVYRYFRSERIDQVAKDYAAAEQAPADQALSQWEKIQEKSLPAELGEMVAMQIGSLYAKQENWEKASKAFQKVETSSSPLLESVGQLARALALENSGRYQEALEIYRLLSMQEKNPLKDEGKLGMARSYVSQGKIAEAESLLFQVMAKDSDSSPAAKSAALSKLIVLKLQQTSTVEQALPSEASPKPK